MKTFNSNQPFVRIDENDVLFIKGSTGTIVLREDEYGARFENGAWQISIEDEVFASKVARLNASKSTSEYYEMSSSDRARQERQGLRSKLNKFRR